MKTPSPDPKPHEPGDQRPLGDPEPGPETITVQGITYTCPFADLLPPLSAEELAALRDDIRNHGIRVDVVVSDEFEVLDGHNRLRLAAELGLTQPILPKIMCGLTAEQKRDAALSLNLHRRHLTAAQRRDLIAKHLQTDPAASDRAIAAHVGVDHKTVGAARKAAEATGEVPHTTSRRGRDGRSCAVRTKPVTTNSTPPASGTPAVVTEESITPAEALTPAASPSPTSPTVVQKKSTWRRDIGDFAGKLRHAAQDLDRYAGIKVDQRNAEHVLSTLDRVTRHLDELRSHARGWPESQKPDSGATEDEPDAGT